MKSIINLSFSPTCIIVIFLVSTVLSDETDDKNYCQLLDENGYEMSDYDWKYGIRLSEIEDTAKPGTTVAKYKYKNIAYIQSTSSPADEYFYIDFDEDYFFIEVDKEFANYEERESNTKLEIKVEFECENRKYRKISFSLNIKDTNNHAPEFLNAPYKFHLPMPIPKVFDIDQAGKIVARDIDLTNEHITFALKTNDGNNNRFSIISNEKNDKNYPTKFIASNGLDLEDDVTLVVYATDSGKPSLTSNTTITITVDKGNSAPRFSHSLYTADLTKLSNTEVNEVIVNFSQGIITLERGYEGVEAFEIHDVSEENNKHLKLTHSGVLQRKKNIELQLKLVDLSEEFLSQRVLSFIVTAVRDTMKSETALQILLPEGKSNDYNTTERVKCEEKSVTENDSIDGYMIATVVLSLVSVALAGFIIYSFVSKNK